MADSLARSESQRRQMMADLAHELRTPLSVIQGNLEAMQDGILPLDGEQVASLHEEALLLGRLVADLRLLSLAEAGQLRLELAEVAPSDLLRKAVERHQQAAQDRHIALSLSTPDALPPAHLDADRINQVVGNLVGNSLRHTPAGGAVKVEAGVVERSRASDGPAPALLVKVTDSGSGVAPEELQSIFERFYRSDKSRSRSSGGSGLGLAIVKQIVELHGGQVWAESPVARTEQGAGYGTTVSFTLPLVLGPR
jgi:two-component system OmpR family sensor kinase/two-component system sensor histidine kinase BaeS